MGTKYVWKHWPGQGDSPVIYKSHKFGAERYEIGRWYGCIVCDKLNYADSLIMLDCQDLYRGPRVCKLCHWYANLWIFSTCAYANWVTSWVLQQGYVYAALPMDTDQSTLCAH